MNTVVGEHMKEYRKEWQNNCWIYRTRKESVGNHFQLSSEEFYFATSQARLAGSLGRWVAANSLVHLLLSRDTSTAASARICPEPNRVERGIGRDLAERLERLTANAKKEPSAGIF